MHLEIQKRTYSYTHRNKVLAKSYPNGIANNLEQMGKQTHALTLTSSVPEDERHAMPFIKKLGRQQLQLFQLPSPSRCWYATRIILKGFARIQSINKVTEQNRQAFSACHSYWSCYPAYKVRATFHLGASWTSEEDLDPGCSGNIWFSFGKDEVVTSF